MTQAELLGLASLAFPAISTGIYRFPPDAAAEIAVRTASAFPAKSLQTVVFCCFSAADLAHYQALLPGLLEGLEAYVPDLTVTKVPNATHWIVHEQPARVAKEIGEFQRRA